LPDRMVELAKAIVRALQPGFRYRCESEGELADRLAHAGVEFEPEDLPVALDVLEQSGVGALDTGALPGLPYRVLRPCPIDPRDSWMDGGGVLGACQLISSGGYPNMFQTDEVSGFCTLGVSAL
jgi:hypothetical protein